jgi:hypothetical protein
MPTNESATHAIHGSRPMPRWRRVVAVLGLPALLGLQQCGSSQHATGDSATGGDPSNAGAPAYEGTPVTGAGGVKGGSENCRLVEKCCPRLAGNDRQACDGIAQVRDDLGCLTLLTLHPECKAAGTGGSSSDGGTANAGGSSGAHGGTGGVGGSGGVSGGEASGGTGGASGRDDGLRHFDCGYALANVSGNPCENGRTTRYVVAKDMTAAIDACVDVQPADRDYFCCVLASDGAEPADQSQCEAAPSLGPGKLAPAWRPGRSCCRFGGETTCPPL